MTLLSLALYVVSLFNDAFYIDAPNPSALAPGWITLVAGPFALFAGSWSQHALAWLANPLMLGAWTTTAGGHRIQARIFAVLALLFMSSFLLQQSIITSTNGDFSKITGRGIGFWIWMLSGIVQVVASFLINVERKAPDTQPLA
ncbi:hypothetical protein ACQ859_17050 [Roseateles chitinivorans]|uniref:hypothetical protein n=1 Tax=Roseateles chitinivorans TaxID=2917965 RepID=UPI003D66F285